MATNIIYKNKRAEIITIEQADQLDHFYVVTEIEGLEKMIIEYIDNRIYYVIYQLEDGELESTVLESLKVDHSDADTFSIIERVISGDYIVQYYRVYLDDSETPKVHRSLIDSEGNAICVEKTTYGEYFVIDPTLQEQSIREKYLYDEGLYNMFTPGDYGMIEGPPYFIFRAVYKVDGTFDFAKYGPSGSEESRLYLTGDFDDLVEICRLTPEQITYYATDHFLPEEVIV